MTATAVAPSQAPTRREHGNAYNIFILVATLFSLAVMLLLVLPWVSEETKVLLFWYDNAVCVIFLADFAYNITGSRPKSQYFIHERGWLDLLGSIPSLGFFQLTALLRLARLSRLARIARIMGGKNRKALVDDVVKNRGQYATFITLLSGGLVLSIASLLVLQFESKSPDANITTGGDALWWGIVTITTVGYGDQYPVTPLGRLTGTFVMLAGVGIIGALASILASLLVPPAKTAEEEEQDAEAKAQAVADEAEVAAKAATASAQRSQAIVNELAQLRAEIADLKAAVTARPG
jgi:voltage-gated potassium channel Kch